MHAADVTGREIERALLAEAVAQPNIQFHEHHLAVDLVLGEVGGVAHCFGVDVLDQAAGSMARFVAPVTMLATGGGGQVCALPCPATWCCLPFILILLFK